MSYYPTGDVTSAALAAAQAAAAKAAAASSSDPNYKPPSATSCAAPLVYVPFYDSCVNPCPPGQSYNSEGICAASTSMSPLAIAAIAVGGLVLYKTMSKKRR